MTESKEVQAFLAKGGQIQKVKQGASSNDGAKGLTIKPYFRKSARRWNQVNNNNSTDKGKK